MRIVLKGSPDLRNCIFISGFHGVGLTGFIAVKHLVKCLNAERIGFIESRFLPPFISVGDSYIIATPFELFKHDKYVFFITEFPPHDKEVYQLSQVIADWVVRSGFSQAILIGGLDKRFKCSDNVLCKFLVTSAFKRLVSKELPLLDKGLHAYGLLALLLARFEIRDFPAIAVLPYADASRPDPLAAANAINFLNSFLGLSIDVSELIRDAERIESEIKMLQQLAKRAKTSHGKTLYM